MTTKEENTTQPKNLIAKIQAIKSELLWKNLKKSWQNKHAWFKYYELSDILPAIIELCTKYGVFTQIIFDNEFAKLEVANVDDPSDMVFYTSPMRDVELKWCQPIQSLWAIETYQRRYLYLVAFDISEPDMLDAVAWEESKSEKKTEEKKEIKEFTEEDFERLKWNKEYVKKFKDSVELLNDMWKYYNVSTEWKMKVWELFVDTVHEWEELDWPFQ